MDDITDRVEELRQVSEAEKETLIRVPGVRLGKKPRQVLALLIRGNDCTSSDVGYVLIPANWSPANIGFQCSPDNVKLCRCV